MSAVARPVIVVLGATADDPPPGIEAAEAVTDLRYAADLEAATAMLAEADGVFWWGADGTWLPAAWKHATRVRWIQSASAGVDSLLFPDLIASGVEVTNARGVFDEPIAEWVIAAMLAFATGLHASILDQQRREWTSGRTTERLEGARLVVVGPGPIGRATGSRALALGMSVALVGREPRRHETFGDVLGVDRLHDALADADHVLDALPLTDATRGLFDAAAFAAMPSRARFYNVGRGGTVDEHALIEALREGVIAGAALDVFATEPLPPESPLWTMPTVIVSPHVSGDVAGWEEQVVAIFVENARRFAAGEPLENLVDKRAGHGAGAPPPGRSRGLPPGPSVT